MSLEHKEFTSDERKLLVEKHEAMPDGSYPIRNRADLANAIQAYGRSKNKEKTKRWIIRRAKELNLTDLLPEDWNSQNGSTEHMDSVKNFLEHYGTKGMKWGVRRSRGNRGGRTRYKDTSTKNLSDDEVQRRIRRMELEVRYNNLNKGQVSTGRDYATGILSNSGRAAAGAAVGTATSFLVARALKRKFG